MNKFVKAVNILLGWSVAIIFGILIMIYGWGLEPQSWWWIIGGGVFIRLIAEFIVQISKIK